MFRRVAKLASLLLCVCLWACQRPKQAQPDSPRLTPNTTMRDVTFRSAALGRAMQYRVILPSNIPRERTLPVVYLLHGGSGTLRDWSNYSDVARFAERGLILVMPEGDESYYTNAVDRPQDRYEDYIVNDLVVDVESKFPVAPDRSHRAILGVSMGGFGAVKLALKHPESFVFVGGLSSALDFPRRPFSIKRIGQWRHHRSIFGPWNGESQRENDPFVLARSADPAKVPYMFLTCGDQEVLLPANRTFSALLAQRHFEYEFHVVPGGHNWAQWNAQLADCFESLLKRVSRSVNN